MNRVLVSGLVGHSSASAWETSVFGELLCGVCSDRGSSQKVSHDLCGAVLVIQSALCICEFEPGILNIFLKSFEHRV